MIAALQFLNNEQEQLTGFLCAWPLYDSLILKCIGLWNRSWIHGLSI